MTPAINVAKKAKIKYTVHKYSHDESAQSYGLEAAEKLAIEESRVFKTLVVITEDKKLGVGIVPVCSKLSMKLMAKALNCKKANMADALDVERATGYILGGVSPLGQKKRLQTVLDKSASKYDTIFVSGGRRGLEIELRPQDLLLLTNGKLIEVSL